MILICLLFSRRIIGTFTCNGCGWRGFSRGQIGKFGRSWQDFWSLGSFGICSCTNGKLTSSSSWKTNRARKYNFPLPDRLRRLGGEFQETSGGNHRESIIHCIYLFAFSSKHELQKKNFLVSVLPRQSVLVTVSQRRCSGKATLLLLLLLERPLINSTFCTFLISCSLWCSRTDK